MQIIKDEIFTQNLKNILKFIAKDSKNRAFDFNNQLFYHINKLPYMPLKCRKSYYYHNENVRDLVFKGYTIPYLIDNEFEKIVILDIFKWSNR